MSNIKTIKYFVTGRVQGVGFRNYIEKKGRQIGIKGWVRNLSDGRVEALGQGSSEEHSELQKFLWRGPMLAKVKAVEEIDLSSDEGALGSDESPSEKLTGQFEARYT